MDGWKGLRRDGNVPPLRAWTTGQFRLPDDELDRRTLTTARTFGVLLRNGQTWKQVKLLETDQGRVLLPKHAVDAYLLDQA